MRYRDALLVYYKIDNMQKKSIETKSDEIVLLQFIEGKAINEQDARRVTENVKDIKDLWLLAKMTVDVQSSD